ncbi:MAG: hypothetical protein KDN20_11695 [Verrucomicrobiae bacterium]|nr:hypothetical protein [Verrucomicrobiae bacterium]
MDYLASFIILIGSLLALAGELGVLMALFRDSKILFILSIVFPPLGLLLFLILRFPVAWKPVLLIIVGVGMALRGYEMLSEEAKAVFEFASL